MKISALSSATGVPIATVKYYLREGLLPPGARTARNQADYGDDHLRQLRLIRALIEVGGLSVAAVRDVLDVVAHPTLPVRESLEVAHVALGPPPDSAPIPDDVAEARAEVDLFIESRGWNVDPTTPSRRALADGLVTLRRLGRDVDVEMFTPYAELADQLAAREIENLPSGVPRTELVERLVVSTVVFERTLIALRRMAQAHHSMARFGPLAPAAAPPPSARAAQRRTSDAGAADPGSTTTLPD